MRQLHVMDDEGTTTFTQGHRRHPASKVIKLSKQWKAKTKDYELDAREIAEQVAYVMTAYELPMIKGAVTRLVASVISGELPNNSAGFDRIRQDVSKVMTRMCDDKALVGVE